VRFALPAGVEIGDLPVRTTRLGSDDGLVEVRTTEPTRVLHDLTGWALDRGIELRGLLVTRPTLEDVYLELTDDQPS
jgi:ABC-2 type transport system ATP-binding protein